MALSGGNWVSQNKVRPGIYVNVVSEPRPLGVLGDRGTVAALVDMNWGEQGKIIKLEVNEDPIEKLGYPLGDPAVLPAREMLKRAKELLLYRVIGGTKATATSGALVATAKYNGTRGNDISIVVEENLEGRFEVFTLVDGSVEDAQEIDNVEELVSNMWVDFSGTGAPTETAGTPLTSGTNPDDATVADAEGFFNAIEVEQFETAVVTVDTLIPIFVNYIKLQRAEGRKIVGVVPDHPVADDESIISVLNGVVLSDGVEIPKETACYWVAGASAGAQANQSLTYTPYDGAVDALPRLSNQETIAALKAGQFVFTYDGNNRAVIPQRN